MSDVVIKSRNDQRSTHHVVEEVKEKHKGQPKMNVELQALKVEMVDPSRLKPNPYNPNKQDEDEFALLRRSIQKDGFTMPVLANVAYVIIDGEHRWRAALAESLKSIPVVRIDVDDVKMKMSTIRHNKARGSHDANLEALVIADLERLVGRDFILDELMLKNDEIDELLSFTSAAVDLAGEEYNPSWTPISGSEIYSVDSENKPASPSVFTMRQSVDKNTVLRSSTEKANLLAYQKAEQGVDVKKRDFYTLTCILPPEEAVMLKDALEDVNIHGNTPAERLYNLVKEIDHD